MKIQNVYIVHSVDRKREKIMNIKIVNKFSNHKQHADLI